MNVGSLAASVGLRPLIFAAIVGSKVPLFASRYIYRIICGTLVPHKGWQASAAKNSKCVVL
jgi:hypothetical protein